jgi:hypothetical protein
VFADLRRLGSLISFQSVETALREHVGGVKAGPELRIGRRFGEEDRSPRAYLRRLPNRRRFSEPSEPFLSQKKTSEEKRFHLDPHYQLTLNRKLNHQERNMHNREERISDAARKMGDLLYHNRVEATGTLVRGGVFGTDWTVELSSRRRMPMQHLIARVLPEKEITDATAN